jgi:hypothetical protein
MEVAPTRQVAAGSSTQLRSKEGRTFDTHEPVRLVQALRLAIAFRKAISSSISDLLKLQSGHFSA